MASFRTFATVLGLTPKPQESGGIPQLSMLSVCEALNFKPKISLWTVMAQIGSPVTPTTLSASLTAPGGLQYQFHWADPFNWSDPPPSSPIRKATSFGFSLWPPDGAAFIQTFEVYDPQTTADLRAYFPDYGSGWSYNYPYNIDVHKGEYTWQLTLINDYGSTPSPVQSIGTSGPRVWFTANSAQTLLTVFGAGFPDNTCTVEASCSMYETRSVTGDITKGVTVPIECQNEGQYWNLTVTAGGVQKTPTYNCIGGNPP
jgi:hypothetical protein